MSLSDPYELYDDVSDLDRGLDEGDYFYKAEQEAQLIWESREQD